MLTQHVGGRRRTSSYSGGNNCVEVGRLSGGAAVRDTKDRAARYITATADQWAAFLAAVKVGRYEG